MTKADFQKHIILSSLLTAAVVAIIIWLCAAMFDKYEQPNEETTSLEHGMVADVSYSAVGTHGVVIEMATGEELKLVTPWSSKKLYASIGYNLDQLAELLEGQTIEYRKMNKLPWIVEIRIGNIVIDISESTSKEIVITHICIIILGLMMLAIPISIETSYLQSKYRLYRKSEKKRIRKAKRKLS